MKKLLQGSFLIFAVVLMALPLLPMTRAVSIPPRDQVVWATGHWQTAGSLNPWDGNPAYGIATMYEMLFGFNAEDGTILPVIGVSYYWESPTSTKCHVVLNPDAKFSDGSSITPEDVVYSYQLCRTNTTNFGPDMRSRIATIEVENTSAVVFTAQAAFPHSGFIDVWLRSNVPIIKKSVWELIMADLTAKGKDLTEFTNDWFDPTFPAAWKVSSGPYFPYYRSATKDVEIYELRTDWWGSGKLHTDLPQTHGVPQAKYIGQNHYSGNTGQDIAFMQGDVDFFAGYMANIWQVMATNPNLNTWFGHDAPYMFGASSMVELALNWNFYPCNQLWFRKALASAVPYEDCSNTGASGYLQRARQGFADDRIAPLRPIYNQTIQDMYAINYNIAYAIGNLSANCYLDTTTTPWTWMTNDATPYLGTPDAKGGVVTDEDGVHAGVNVALGPYSTGMSRCIVPNGWTDVVIATNLWCTSFTTNLNVTMVMDDSYSYDAWTAAFKSGTYVFGLMCSSPKLMNDPVVFFNGYRGAIAETGAAEFNRNTSNWVGPEATAYSNAFDLFETLDPNSVEYKQQASIMQLMLASTVPTIPLYGNGFWYAYNDEYWTGWVSEANKFNQITTVWDNDNMVIRTRLMLNLIPSGVIPLDLTLIFGIVAIGAIVALVIAVIVMRKRGA